MISVKNDRVKNTERNIVWGAVNMVISLLLPFVARTILLRVLGEEYLGLSSLFTSILQMLNIAELGLSSAIIFGLYKPIAEDDTDTIRAYMMLYRKAYKIIGLVIATVGILILPFLKYLINGAIPNDINIYALYLIYLSNSALSYFAFAYKSTLLSAHHRNDIVSNIATFVNILKYVVQIVVLLLTRNFYIYIIVLPICTLVNNLITSVVVDKKYPLYSCSGNLKDEERKKIVQNVKGLVVTRMCAIMRDSADIITISAFLSLIDVAMFSNYFFIMSSVHSILTIITNAMRAGVGNSLAVESIDKNIKDMNKFTYYYAFITSCCVSCLVALYQPFMELWVGESLSYPFYTMVLFVIYFYLLCSMDIRNVYIEAAGLWSQFRTRAIIETVCNFTLSILLVNFFGINGIIFATIVTYTIVNIVYGSSVLIRNLFKEYGFKRYIFLFVKYTTITLIVAVLVFIISTLIPDNNILFIILKGAVCAICSAVFFMVFTIKDKHLKSGINLIKNFGRW